jgi:hypothetical protein
MAQDRTVHTKHLGENRYRDLDVYYDKGGMNYWDSRQKPKGIYFATMLYTKSGGCRTWSTGQKGDGYLLAVPLERYSAKQLRLVRERVEIAAEQIHDILAGRYGTFAELKAYIEGKAVLPTAPDATTLHEAA